jgi:ubiquinone/menaquinone biosynthesis C-methylase UbiE
MKMQNTNVVSAVSAETWERAQHWEREFWLRQQRNLAKYGKNYAWRLLSLLGRVEPYRGDDDNTWWSKTFDGYRFLPAKVANMIEVGCGPYTNARLVWKACAPEHLTLSDPLIRTYVDFKMTMVREMTKRSFCYLDDHPLEDLPFRDEYFDVAIMINVLDHVRDAVACMNTLIRIVKPGGHIIIGQDLTNEEDLKSHPDGMRTGHPITLDAAWFAPYLADFSPSIQKVLSREEGRTPQWHYATLVYAGTKR